MEETWELAALVMSNKVNYRASNTRLRYQLVLSALVFCLGATYGVKELKIPGVLTFVSSPNVNLILFTILGFSIFTLFSFAVQHSLYRLENPAERKEIGEYRQRIEREVSSIRSHFDQANKKLDSIIEAYSNLPPKEARRLTFIDDDPKPEDPNMLKIREFVVELQSISSHSKRISDEQFIWEEYFSGEESPDKIFYNASINLKLISQDLASSLGERRIYEDKISSSFDKLSNRVLKLELRSRKFRAALKSFSDARWLDRFGLRFLVPLIEWAFLVIFGIVQLGPKLVEVNKSSVEQQTISDEMGKP